MNQSKNESLEIVPKEPAALSATTDIAQSRSVAEAQAAMVIAKRFPRNQLDALERIINACTRPQLAETALYQYARGGLNIAGPSIRLAETMAQQWGNIEFGIIELDQDTRAGVSIVEAFAWDLEANTREVRVFHVPHIRFTKQGSYRLNDPRDIYEHVANQGARRLRACILGIIPPDVREAAVQQCENTLVVKTDITPQRIANLIEKFGKYGITRGMIESRIQRNIETITPALMVNLGKIYNSLTDGMSSASDWFDIEAKHQNLEVGESKIIEQPTENQEIGEDAPPSDRKATSKSRAVLKQAVGNLGIPVEDFFAFCESAYGFPIQDMTQVGMNKLIETIKNDPKKVTDAFGKFKENQEGTDCDQIESADQDSHSETIVDELPDDAELQQEIPDWPNKKNNEKDEDYVARAREAILQKADMLGKTIALQEELPIGELEKIFDSLKEI